jgi:hypothetical protein
MLDTILRLLAPTPRLAAPDAGRGVSCFQHSEASR